RTTILTGLYAHNHGVKTNNPPEGGFEKFVSNGDEQDTIATRLQQSGYETGLFGKYLNSYPGNLDTTHVPPGWNEWHAWADTLGKNGSKNSTNKGGGESQAEYYEYSLNENGQIASYGNSPEDYMTDVLSSKAKDFVHSAASDSKPFFLYLSTTAPHGGPIPAERHKGAFAGQTIPHPPSFDEQDISGKPPWIREKNLFSNKDVSSIDELYQERSETMLAVDDMVGSLVQELEDNGQLDNTFIFFTSDNGYILGEHRIQADKRYPYEEAIRVPLFVRGPGVPAGSKVENMILNTDFAPTFAELAGASSPPTDGRSLVPLLLGEDPPSWRSAFLLEWYGERNPKRRNPPPYEAIRTENYKYVEYDSGDKELYDLQTDPYELNNTYDSADPSLVANLKTQLDSLGSCKSGECQKAEDGA
ncbi:MAG: sulfatase, partial [Actinobacteria bacterium]|nr:sulfatase [Actinomycetota bacterium]